MIIPNFPLRSTCHTDEAVEEPLDDVHPGREFAHAIGRGTRQGVSDGDHIQVAVEGEDAQGKGLVERQLKCWCFIFFTFFFNDFEGQHGTTILV